MQAVIKNAAIDKVKPIFEEKQLHIWYNILQALDKNSILFLRPYKGNVQSLGCFTEKN